MDVTERRRTLVQAVHAGITHPSDRGTQKGIGPSEIGNPCDYCVAKALCRRFPHLWGGAGDLRDDHFALKAWLGTAVHEKLERDVGLEGAAKESTLKITHLEGYGDIVGHADLMWNGVVCDYKTIDKSRLDLVRLNGPPQAYVSQINLYAYGARQHHDQDIDQVCLFFIPRDSNKLEDIYPAFATYRADLAALALSRLRTIWDLVQQGRGPDLAAHPECYRCTVRSWV